MSSLSVSYRGDLMYAAHKGQGELIEKLLVTTEGSDDDDEEHEEY